jgi:lysophospholipase L1-like esterase
MIFTLSKKLVVLLALVTAAAACHRHPAKLHRAHAVRLDDGTFRVVVIGDSLAAGTGDPTGKGIAGNLEDELRGRGTIDVKNYGIAGNTTSDVLSRLQNDDLRNDITTADAIVLSAGANNVFQDPEARARAIRDRDVYAREILEHVAEVVAEIRRLNPDAPLLLLGGYNPIPDNPLKSGINRYLKRWDNLLEERFASDPLTDVVKTLDIIDSADKLSPADHFHPGADAYREIAHRIASIL